MPTFTGKFEQRAGTGTVQQGGPCRLTFEEESFRIVTEKGPGLAIDLGDIDAIESGDYELKLRIYDGTTLLLNQFAKPFQQMRHDLLDAWHRRLIQCLLLEDLEEITRIDGFAQLESADRRFSSQAEIRLFKSNLAVLPTSAPAIQWRLAEIDVVDFDEATYTLGLRSGQDRLILTRLAKRTREFAGQLRDAIEKLSDKSAQVIHALFPFLSPDQFAKASMLLKEGRTVPVSQLAAIHSTIGKALAENAVSSTLQPYYKVLSQKAVAPGPYFGFKLVRKEEETKEKEEEEAAAQAGPQEEVPAGDSPAPEEKPPVIEFEEESLLCWFFFPLSGTSATQAGFGAWECTNQSGRATYVFRMSGEIDAAIRRINRGIVVVNFRREPIYLPDSSLEIQPRYRRYAIAQRNVSVLREVRSSLVGRAIHMNPQTWQKQLDSLLRK
jgi:hypothetical protein